MIQVREKVAGLLSGLYASEAVDHICTAAAHYVRMMETNPGYVDVPPSLHDVTSARKMKNPNVPAPEGFRSELLEHLGILDRRGTLVGPLNHVLARMITVPTILPSYLAGGIGPEEKAQYRDPPILQMDREALKALHGRHFAKAADVLKDRSARLERYRTLGMLGQDVSGHIETAYAATGSTQAYELFGIWHLFPKNQTVDLTATSPGVILPTEADPMRYSVPGSGKNLVRPSYFDMLVCAVAPELGGDRRRRYFASREGTRKGLLEHPEFLDAAKDMLRHYLALGSGVFEIRTGVPLDEMKRVTLVGDIGVVYSVRDPADKKIAHNVTVINPDEACAWRKIFERQWEAAEPVDSVGAIDRLVA